jgi:hypothetical protein
MAVRQSESWPRIWQESRQRTMPTLILTSLCIAFRERTDGDRYLDRLARLRSTLKTTALVPAMFFSSSAYSGELKILRGNGDMFLVHLRCT